MCDRLLSTICISVFHWSAHTMVYQAFFTAGIYTAFQGLLYQIDHKSRGQLDHDPCPGCGGEFILASLSFRKLQTRPTNGINLYLSFHVAVHYTFVLCCPSFSKGTCHCI